MTLREWYRLEQQRLTNWVESYEDEAKCNDDYATDATDGCWSEWFYWDHPQR